VTDSSHSVSLAAEPGSVVKAKRDLVADDQPDVLHAISLLLKLEGFESLTVGHPAEVIAALKNGSFDLLITDLNYTLDTTSGTEGLDLISSIRKINANVPVLVITAWGTIELAVAALQRGASDFIQKPWTNSQLIQKSRDLIERAELARRARVEAEQEQEESAEIQRKLPLAGRRDQCATSEAITATSLHSHRRSLRSQSPMSPAREYRVHC